MASDDDDWFARRFGGDTEDSWRICTVCTTFEPFAGHTDTCCLTARGIACIFPERPQRPRAASPKRARGPPRGSRSRSNSRTSNHDFLARAAQEAAERAADRAERAGAAARQAAGLAEEAAAEARAAAGAARIHASVAQAARNAAAAPVQRLAVTDGWTQLDPDTRLVSTPDGAIWAVPPPPHSTQPPARRGPPAG